MQTVPISLQKKGKIAGRVVFFKKNKKPSFYKNKIVIIPDLNLSEDVFYLKKTKAIIAECGGITSHGANLAREYKISCFNLPKAFKKLKEGEKTEISVLGEIFSQIPTGKKFKYILTAPKQYLKKSGWYLTRAYARSPLESFLEKEGIEKTPQVLLHQKSARCYFDKSGLRWVKGFPMPDQIAKKIIQDPAWFFKKVKERQKLYQKIKKYTYQLVAKLKNDKLTLEDYLEELAKIRQIYIQRRPHTALTQHPLDFIEGDFYKLVNFLSLSLKTELFNTLLKTEYARVLSKSAIAPLPREKTIIFSDKNPLVFVKAKINYSKRPKLGKEIQKIISAKPKAFRKKFQRYLETLFLLTKLSDETAYLRRILRVCLIKILSQVGKFLVERKRIYELKQVLNYPVQELVKITEEEIKKTKKTENLKELFKRDPRIERVYNFAKERHKNAAGVIIHHSFDHIIRVLYRAILIANSEKEVNFSVLIPAVLLHDVGVTVRKNNRHHSENSVIVAQKVLPKFGFNRLEIKEICQAIATHGNFSVKKRKEPKILEAKILWDSDALERSSLAAVFYLYGIFFEKKVSLDKFVKKRIKGLQRRMQRGYYTQKAKEMDQNGIPHLLTHFHRVLKILNKRKDFLITEESFKKIIF